jgi:hypothetical protein
MCLGGRSEILNFQLGWDFESVAKLWLQNKKYKFVNIVTSAMLWTLWKFRNDLVFQGARARLGWGRFSYGVLDRSRTGGCC